MVILTPQQADEAVERLVRSKLSHFTEKAFRTVSSANLYVHNWHIDCTAEHLTACYEGQMRRLIINMPPRAMKSILTSVAFPAWVLGHKPSERFMCISYAEDLAVKHSTDTRMVMQSDWYKQVFPNTRIARDADQKMQFATTETGGRMATTTGGTITGLGGNFLILDDPHNAKEALSEVKRMGVIAFLEQGLLSRLDDKTKGVIIIVMQRLHQHDLTGHLLGKNSGWTHLKLPSEARESVYLHLNGKEWRMEAGQLLQPIREPAHVLNELKTDMGSYAYAGQYLQEPVPAGGAMFKKDWLRYYTNSDTLSWRGFIPYILVDTSKGETLDSDYTAMIVICTGSDGNYYITDIIRDRLNVTQRVEAAFMLHEKWKGRTGLAPKIGYEEVGMMDDIFHLRKEMESRRYNMNLVKLGAVKSKKVRIAALVPEFENNRVYLPHSLVYIDVNKDRRDLITEFVNDEYLYYPVSARKDMLDAMAKILEPDLAVRFPAVVAPQPKPLNRDNFQWGGSAGGNNNEKGWL